MTALTAIDVCAGAGGFSLGLHRAGFDVLGVEKDPDAVATHRKYVGPCDEADITEWSPPGPVDLVVGGVPCQPYSPAGNRKGLDDPRGMLFVHLFRIAREACARMVIMENSDGLRSSEGALDAVIRECRRQGFGLGGALGEIQFQTLCAADYGTPQKRYRLFIVGTRLGATWRWPAPTHGDGPMVPLFGLKPWVTVRQALGLGGGPRRHGRIDGAVGWNGQRMLDVDGCAPTVTSRTNPELLDEPACTILTRCDCDPPKGRPSSALLDLRKAVGGVLDAPANTVSAGGTGGGGGAEPFANADYRRKLSKALDQPALTLGAGHDTYPDGEASAVLHRAVHDAGQAIGDALVVAGLSERPATTISGDARVAKAGHHERQQKGAVRLSVDQCSLLQGFPPGWEWTGNKSSQHKQVGNAVPPQLSEALGRSAWEGLQCS